MEYFRDCSLKHCRSKDEESQHREIHSWSPGKMHYKTTRCCLSPFLGESLIINSFQLNSSFWTPCRVGCLHLKAERSLFPYLQGVIPAERVSRFIGICGGLSRNLHSDFRSFTLQQSEHSQHPSNSGCLFTEKGKVKSPRSLSNHSIRTCNVSSQQKAGESEMQDLSQLYTEFCIQLGLS